MNNLFKLGTVALLLTGVNAYAHHPAADIVDPEVYEMIEENISEVHLDMTFDDMGGDTTDVGSAMEARDDDVGNMGAAPGGDIEDVGAAMAGNLEDVGAAMESREEMNSMASVEPGGPGARR